MSKYSDEELMNLTDEEREALEAEGEDQGHDEDTETHEGDADESTAEDDASDAEGDEDDAQADKENAGEAEEEEEKTARREEQHAPLLTADAPEGADEKLKEISEQKNKLVEQFDDGDLTAREYQSELDKLAKAEREIELALHKSQIAAEMQEQQAKNAWLSTVNTFLDENPEYREKKRLYAMLDIEVRDIAADEANAGMSGRDILEKAHQNIADELGILAQQPAGKQKPKGKRAIDAPPTLARVPAAEHTDVDNGRWAQLDRLMERDPERYEAEIAKLSDADREAYLTAQ